MISQMNNWSIKSDYNSNNKNSNTTRIPKKTLDMQDFIQLFITQLQYQDPMNPIDNNEMATQLALFNQVDQLFNITKELNNLMDMAKSFDLAYVSDLIGKKVKVETKIGRVENGKFLGGEFKLDNPVNYLEIAIRDSKGKLVDNVKLEGLKAGIHKIDWDATDKNGNKVPDGNYTFSIVIPEENTTKTVTPTMIAHITGAKLGDKIQLVIDGNQTIGLDKIKEILED